MRFQAFGLLRIAIACISALIHAIRHGGGRARALGRGLRDRVTVGLLAIAKRAPGASPASGATRTLGGHRRLALPPLALHGRGKGEAAAERNTVGRR